MREKESERTGEQHRASGGEERERETEMWVKERKREEKGKGGNSTEWGGGGGCERDTVCESVSMAACSICEGEIVHESDGA